MILNFRDKIWQKLNIEISWKLRQISDCNCRLFDQISKRRVYQNSLSHHSEKITHTNLCCFVDWSNPQMSFSFTYLPTNKQKIAHRLHAFFCLSYRFTNSCEVPWNISIWKRLSQSRKKSTKLTNLETLHNTADLNFISKARRAYCAELSPLLIRNYPLQPEMFSQSQSWW